MVAAAFVAPYLLEATARFVTCAASLPGVRLGLVTSEPLERVPPDLRDRLAGHWRVDNALDPKQVAEAVTGLGRQMGRVERLVVALEQLQVPLAEVREGLIATLRQRRLEEMQAAYVAQMLERGGLAINEVALRKALTPQ